MLLRKYAPAVALLLAAAAAGAHTKLARSSPPAGAVLDAAPEAVELHFAGAIQAAFSRVRVLDADGRDVAAASTPAAMGAKGIRAPLVRDVPRGVYDVRYEVVSADGHRLEGSFRFEVRPPAAPAGTP